MENTLTPLRHIRRTILGVTQQRLAELTGVSQATVSRWEDGELFPSLNEMSAIRNEAIRLGKEWDDGLFFSTPESSDKAGAAA